MPKDDFIPLAIETYGCFHLCFESFLTSCVHACIACHQQSSSLPLMLIFHYRQQMSITLQRAQAITILQQVSMLNHSSSSFPHIPANAPSSIADLWQRMPF